MALAVGDSIESNCPSETGKGTNNLLVVRDLSKDFGALSEF